MIIPVFRVVATQYPIQASTTIEAGSVVALDSNGYATACGSGGTPIGIAADTNRAIQSGEWSNRVSDYGNETAASGKLSVYHGGGEFYVDVDDSAVYRGDGSTLLAGIVVSDAVTTPGQALYTAASGQMDDASGGETQVATVLEAAASLESGIPAEYEPYSWDLVSDDTPRTWVKIKLEI